MLEDYNFLHSGLDDQTGTKPSIHIVLLDLGSGGPLKDYLEKAFPVDVFLYKDTINYWEAFTGPKGLFCLITDDSFSGMELIEKHKRKNLSFKTILITDSIRPGDHLSVTKPISYDRVKVLVENIFPSFAPKNINESFYGLIGKSPKMQEVFNQIRNNSGGPRPILISGPEGTGKNTVAEAIIKNFGTTKSYLISCATLSGDALESELYDPQEGKLKKAQGGVVYIKDIDKLPLLLQAKMIKYLKNENSEAIKILASTTKDLIDLSSSGDFRKDLLNLFGQKISLPSLFDREGDLTLLIKYFNKKYSSVHQCLGIEFDGSALDILKSYDWPENVSELENLIEKLVILHTGTLITPGHLSEKFFIGEAPGSVPYALPEKGIDLRRLLRDIEDSLIHQALEKTGGNKNRASKLLQINRTTLVEKLKKRKRESNNQVT